MIHQYKLNGYNVVVDAASGSVHSVDDVAYDLISSFDERVKGEAGIYSAADILNDKTIRTEIATDIAGRYKEPIDDIQETIDDIASLNKEGLLWSEDPFEAAADAIKLKQSVLKAICLHVAHGCNMDCEYCFAGKGDYSGKSGIMSAEVGKKALDYLVEHSGTRKHLEVDFFGGEPLINWEVCKEIVAYGRELEKTHNKIFNFTLTTNGVLIDQDVIDFTNREMGNVVLSMDGRRKTHDRMRKSKTGEGTYDSIMGNFKALVDARTSEDKEIAEDRRSSEYYMRGTYTAYNKDFAADVLAMADLGFRETSIEPVVSDPSAPYALSEDDLPGLYKEYEKLALEMLKREEQGEGFNFYHYTVDLTGGPCIYKRVAGCGVSTEYLAVTPSGDLYPCHQFVGDDEMLVGNIWDGITHPEILSIFEGSNNVYTRDKCKDCWARLYCAGGCAANNYHSNGDINKVYEFGCRLHRKRIECALMMEVCRSERDPGGN
ncbi:MAG: thioether cross-link-forming SCIFF peptide maturase [Mogibacterium sp.]|nr:thioether cross-link-forming SCIFF peptide maturase [Mogibacterium sp.]